MLTNCNNVDDILRHYNVSSIPILKTHRKKNMLKMNIRNNLHLKAFKSEVIFFKSVPEYFCFPTYQNSLKNLKIYDFLKRNGTKEKVIEKII